MKAIKFFALAVIFSGVSVMATAQSSATATSSATIVTPIAITKNQDMNFGNVAVNSTEAGTVILKPEGGRTAKDGVTLPATTGTVTAAQFNVTGADGYTFAITLPTDITISNGAGGSMIVNNFISTPDGTGTISGVTPIKVGATLNVAAGQAAGLYKNETGFEVIVNYN